MSKLAMTENVISRCVGDSLTVCLCSAPVFHLADSSLAAVPTPPPPHGCSTLSDFEHVEHAYESAEGTYDDILAACAEAWKFLTEDPERIRSIGSRSWASVSG
jgi:hypothetical protein